MREPPLILVVDDVPDNVEILQLRLESQGYEIITAGDGEAALAVIPVIMVTARADAKDVLAGLEAGGDDYLTKPVDQSALLARARAMLRIEGLHDTVQEQAHRLE